MMNLTVFAFEKHSVRFVGTAEQPEWVAQDICECLELSDTSKALEPLEADEKGTKIIRTPGGEQEMLTLTEPGLYRTIFKSRKAIAKRFQRWVFHEVLPSIRKTGSYSLPSAEFELKKLELELIRAKQHLQDTGYAIQLSTSPAMLQWLRGETPPPKEFVYLDHFIDSRSGREIGSAAGRSLTQLITDVGLNPKSKRDKDRVKSALKRRGFDYDRMENWEKASYLREYPVLSDQVYPQVLRAVQGEVMTGESEQNLFVHQMQQAALNQHDKPLGLQGVEQP